MATVQGGVRHLPRNDEEDEIRTDTGLFGLPENLALVGVELEETGLDLFGRHLEEGRAVQEEGGDLDFVG